MLHLRRLMKLSHTLGAIGLMGAMACLLVLFSLTPPPAEIAHYAQMRGAIAKIATWIFLPSLGLTLIAGLLAIALNPAFHNAGWAWVKALSGILLFEYGFIGIEGPMKQEAELAARVLAGEAPIGELSGTRRAEIMSLWILLGVAAANIVLAIWRPKLTRIPD